MSSFRSSRQPRERRRRPTRSRILAFVQQADGPVSPKEIIDETGLSENSVYTTVRKMLDDGDLTQPEYGLYEAPDAAADGSPPEAGPSTAGRNGTRGDAVDPTAGSEPPRPAPSRSDTGEASSTVDRSSADRPSSPASSSAPASKSAPAHARSDEARHVAVPLVRIGTSGEDPFTTVTPAYATYDRRHIAQETGADPDRLVFLAATGTAMAPTVSAGDRLLVARHDGEALLEGDLYVFRRSGRGVLLRRVFWTADGTLRLTADADDASDLTANPERAAAWQILGRVLQVHRSV